MTDELLMIAVKHGELEKASELFDRYHKRLYNFFVKITFDRELGHDLTQNVFLRMIRYRGTYKEDKQFKAWIYQLARNIYADHFRRNKMMYSDYTGVEDLKNKIAAVDEVMVQDEKEKLLYISLFKLAPEQREILILTRFQQMKYEEVAQILDCSVANVKVKVHRAIKQLREKYFELEKI
ncbi:DNA-directed RNA polymerase specialized sigma subunit [Fulvivirga imtechensis AK7]|uniref:DNA-directed RNA polymerase specialized sigma subunit n=1 Tax=Fulvivirga imtechensis AK7 TaxID=1237149 RepID=L8JLF6_9BACT|nr:RNA polymerase sigma factor [Fulvivirga imtechensis]ELR69088.1 DNA-directed RNA polymerase specialized sigma subunit [Fulvivirga imtechensis AK7]